MCGVESASPRGNDTRTTCIRHRPRPDSQSPRYSHNLRGHCFAFQRKDAQNVLVHATQRLARSTGNRPKKR